VPASKLFYFREWTIKRRVARLRFLDATTGSTQSLPVRIADGEYMITSLKISSDDGDVTMGGADEATYYVTECGRLGVAHQVQSRG